MVDVFPLTKTIFSFEDFVKELTVAWKKMFMNDIGKQQAKLIFAKFCHESGGGKACWNYNIGNIKWRSDSFGNSDGYCMLPGTWEIVNGKKVIYHPPHPATYFRNYSSLSNGIIDYLNLLNRSRYAKAFISLKNGDLENYAIELHNAGYYTDDPKNYINGLKSWSVKFPEKYFDSLFEKPIENPQEKQEEPIKVIHNDLPIDREIIFDDGGKINLTTWQKIVNFVLKLIGLIK